MRTTDIPVGMNADPQDSIPVGMNADPQDSIPVGMNADPQDSIPVDISADPHGANRALANRYSQSVSITPTPMRLVFTS